MLIKSINIEGCEIQYIQTQKGVFFDSKTFLESLYQNVWYYYKKLLSNDFETQEIKGRKYLFF